MDGVEDDPAYGFVFEGADHAALEGALNRGLKYCTNKKEWWAEMQEKVMNVDNSWEIAGQNYIRLYRGMQY